jgi:glycine/D-amino acid oxidase-like deaminating enzyme
MKVIVVGGGIMGLCTAWAARRAGLEPVLYEQGPIPNPLASSCDQHRVIRFTYGAMDGYARMVRDAYAAWDRLWQDLGRSHYHETGTLAVAREEDGWVRDSAAGLQAMAVPVQELGPAEIAARLPFLDLAGARFGLFTPTGGALFAERILADLARWLPEHGVPVHTGTRVEAVDPARAAIRTAAGAEDAGDALILTPGPWAPRLIPALRGRVTPSRQVVVYLEPPPEHLAAWCAAPMLLDQIEAARGGFYAIPPVGGTPLKIGDHGFSLSGQPEQERAPTPEDVQATLAMARTRLAGFERYRVREARTCFYSISAEERFIAEPLERAWVLAGFSGHGFKFGALIGEAMVEVLTGARAPAAMTAWAAGRA